MPDYQGGKNYAADKSRHGPFLSKGFKGSFSERAVARAVG
jgi:hypothetical protein